MVGKCQWVNCKFVHCRTHGKTSSSSKANSKEKLTGTRITNVFSSVDLGTRVDLHYLALHLWNAHYEPKKNPALVIVTRNPAATVSIFASGNMTCIGTKSPEDSKLAMKTVARDIRSHGMDAKRDSPDTYQEKKAFHAHDKNAIVFKEFRITNMSGASDCGHRVRLEALAHDYSANTTFETELSPDVKFQMVHPVIVSFRIFASGKILIQKVKSQSDFDVGIAQLFKLLAPYRLS